MESDYIEWPALLPAPLLERSHECMPRSSRTEMETRRIRVRPVFEASLQLLAARWNFTQDQFESFEEFFITDLEQGAQSFWLVTNELAGDGGRQDVSRLLAFWESYTFSRSDNLYSVSAVLQVRDANTEAEDLCEINIVGLVGGGDNLDCYLGNLPMQGLASGSLGGAWVDNPLWVSIWAEDSFQSYSGGVVISGLNGGLVWGGAWVDSNLYVSVVAEDSFDSYADDTLMTGLNGGNGWDSAWVDSTLTG